jgi:phosphatidate cytidylyltransferase
VKKRVVSTLVLWSLLIFGLVYGGLNAGLMILLFFSLLAQYEFYSLIEKFGYACFKFIGLAAGAVLLIGAWFQPAYTLDISLSVLAVTVSFLSITQLLIHLPKKYGNPLPGTLWGILYIPFMLQFYARLVGECRAYEPKLGVHLVLWSIAIAKFTDVGALLAGKCLGKHLMAPQISPKKTWEGLLGGLIMGYYRRSSFSKEIGA